MYDSLMKFNIIELDFYYNYMGHAWSLFPFLDKLSQQSSLVPMQATSSFDEKFGKPLELKSHEGYTHIVGESGGRWTRQTNNCKGSYWYFEVMHKRR